MLPALRVRRATCLFGIKSRFTACLLLAFSASGVDAGGISPVPGLPLSGGTLTGPLTVSNSIQGTSFKTPGNTITLSGSTVPTIPISIIANWAGTSTIAGNTALYVGRIGAAADNAALTNGGRSDLLLGGNYGGASFTGGRRGLAVQMTVNTPSSVGASDFFVGYASVVAATVNMGGVASGYGTTQFGIGNIFGANPWARCSTGFTFGKSCIGEEIDASVQAGAAVSDFAVLQLVITSDHATQGVIRDTMLELGSQVGASAGVRNLIAAGRYDAQFPLDVNGYMFQVQSSQNGVAAAGAGGFDLNQFSASGSGPEGGGFYWRSPGAQILDDGVQAGYLSVSQGTGLTTISGNYSKMATAAGSITVAAGGSNWSTGDIACDAYGNCVIVTAPSGAVTAVSAVLSRGYQTSPPADPVAFTVRTRSGGSGLTLNLGSWTAGTTVAIGGSGNTRIGTGSALATNATTGMLLIPSMAGTPSGNVGALGQVALNYDSTNKKLCVTIGATVECTAAMTP